MLNRYLEVFRNAQELAAGAKKKKKKRRVEASGTRKRMQQPQSPPRKTVRGLMSDIEQLLRDGPWQGKNPRKGFSTNRHMSLGRSSNALGAKSFETEHTWLPGRGLYMTDMHERYSGNTFRGHLWRRAYALLRIVDPWYAKHQDYVLQVSKIQAGDAVPLHVDGQDATYQLAFTLGDFKGGELRLHGTLETNNLAAVTKHTPSKTWNNRYKVIRFDGRQPHDVTPVTSGTRYCVIFYKGWDRRLKGPQKRRPPAIVWPR